MIRLAPLLLLVAVATSSIIENQEAPPIHNTESRNGGVMCKTRESCLQYWQSVNSAYNKLFRNEDDNQARNRGNTDSSFSSRSSSNEESDQLKLKSFDDDENNSNVNDLYFYDDNKDNTNGGSGKQNEDTHSLIRDKITAVVNKKEHRSIRSVGKHTHDFDETNDNNDNHEFGPTRLWNHGAHIGEQPSPRGKENVHKGRVARHIVDWKPTWGWTRTGSWKPMRDWKPRGSWKIPPRWPRLSVKCTKKPRPILTTKAPIWGKCIKYSPWLQACIRWSTRTSSTGLFSTTTKPRPVVQFTSTPKRKESTQPSSVPTQGQSTQFSSVPTQEHSTQSSSAPTQGQSTQPSSTPTQEQSTQSSSAPTQGQSTGTVPVVSVESTTIDLRFMPV